MDKIQQSILSNKRIAILSLLVILSFTFLRWNSNDRDFTSFVCLSESRVIEDIFDRNFRFQKTGYDGIYFYCYAHDPLAMAQWAYDERRNDTVPHIQGVIQARNSSFRKKRVGYSAAAWIFSGFGNPKFIPFSLVLVNVLAFFGLILGMIHLLKLKERPTIWSLYLLVLVGAYACIARDLSDLLALSWALWVLVFLEKRWILLATFTALLTLFTKENLGFFILIPMLVYWIKVAKEGFDSGMRHAVLFLMPYICFFLWLMYLTEDAPHSRGLTSTLNNFTWPFYGMFSSIKGEPTTIALNGVLTLSIFSMVAEAGLDLIKKFSLPKTSFDKTLIVTFLTYLLVSVCFSYKIYEDYWSIGRNLLPLQLAAFIWLIWSKRKISLFNVIVSISTALLFTLIMIIYP